MVCADRLTDDVLVFANIEMVTNKKRAQVRYICYGYNKVEQDFFMFTKNSILKIAGMNHFL